MNIIMKTVLISIFYLLFLITFIHFYGLGTSGLSMDNIVNKESFQVIGTNLYPNTQSKISNGFENSDIRITMPPMPKTLEEVLDQARKTPEEVKVPQGIARISDGTRQASFDIREIIKGDTSLADGPSGFEGNITAIENAYYKNKEGNVSIKDKVAPKRNEVNNTPLKGYGEEGSGQVIRQARPAHPSADGVMSGIQPFDSEPGIYAKAMI